MSQYDNKIIGDRFTDCDFFKSEKYMCVIETCHDIHVNVLTGTIKPG